MLRLLFNFLFTILLGAITVAYYRWPDLEDYLRCLLVKVLAKKLCTRVTVDALHLNCWGIELRGVLIANGPAGSGKQWQSPHALKLKSLKLQFGRLHSLCSVLLPTFRLDLICPSLPCQRDRFGGH